MFDHFTVKVKALDCSKCQQLLTCHSITSQLSLMSRNTNVRTWNLAVNLRTFRWCNMPAWIFGIHWSIAKYNSSLVYKFQQSLEFPEKLFYYVSYPVLWYFNKFDVKIMLDIMYLWQTDIGKRHAENHLDQNITVTYCGCIHTGTVVLDGTVDTEGRG